MTRSKKLALSTTETTGEVAFAPFRKTLSVDTSKLERKKENYGLKIKFLLTSCASLWIPLGDIHGFVNFRGC